MLNYYFIFKILSKLKLNNFLYPIFHFINDKFLINSSLPTERESIRIINKNSKSKKNSNDYKRIFKLKHNSNYNLQIIVPTFNCAKYINRCLNSILEQDTDYKYQIIIINDGSTDNTQRALMNYKFDSDIKIINQPNEGRSDARNTGLNYVTSDYIMFIDADDILAPNAIQNLLSTAYKLHSDMVFGSYYSFNNKKVLNKVLYKDINDVSLSSLNNINGYVWGKVIKSSLFNKIRFPSGYEFEDTIMAFWIYPLCKKISSISSNVYFYRNNLKSISHNFRSSNISIDSFLITDLIIRSLSKYNISIDEYIYNIFLLQIKINCIRISSLNIYIQKSVFVLTCYLYVKYFNGYHSDIKYYRPLEKSLQNENFTDYILFCMMK